MHIFKSLTGYTDCGGYETQNVDFLNNNNKIKGNKELMLVILNCTLHNQNDGWTVP